MMEQKNRILQLLSAVDAERKSEAAYFKEVLAKESIHKRVSEGWAWHPVKILRKYYTIGECVEVELERTGQVDTPHKFKVGMSAALRVPYQKEVSLFKGSVSAVKQNVIRILMRNDDIMFDEVKADGPMSLELIQDERSYQVMTTALQAVANLGQGILKELRDGILSGAALEAEETNEHIQHFSHPNLNPSQILAVKGAAAAKQVAIIHGPPGTGKTTTLIALTQLLLKTEKSILICASSNNAVDLLASSLHQKGIPVLRVGNISRIDDDILELTIEEKLRNHPEWQHIKKVKIQAEEAKRSAKQFKRSFTSEDRMERAHLYQTAKELRKWANDLEDRLTDKIINESRVVLSTLIGCSHSILEGRKFKTLIIDEASQALEPECWNAILKAERLIMAGDHKQLPPTVKSKDAAKLGLEETLLDRLTDRIAHSYLLDTQYRMNTHILRFSNEMFYGGKLKSADEVAERRFGEDAKPFIFIDTAGTGFEERFNNQHKSYANDGEYFIIREHLLENYEKIVGSSIAIISPYAEQVRFIRERIGEDPQLHTLQVEVDTIDGFQGQERALIYISLVRSNPKSEIGFLKDPRRLNVAMTRAMKKLVVVGDSSTIGNDSLFGSLLAHVDTHECYVSAWEYMA